MIRIALEKRIGRPTSLVACDDRREDGPDLRAALLEDPEEVLDDDDRRVDDDAEVDRPHRDQVRRDAGEVEEEERAEKRERDDRRHDERGAGVPDAEEGDEDEEDEADPFRHVPADGRERPLDERRPVVVRDDPDARRKARPVDLVDLLPHLFENGERVLAFPEKDDPLDDVVLVVPGRRLSDLAETEARAVLHGRDVADPDRRAAPRGDGDLPDVVEVADEPESSDDVHLGAVLDVGAAGVPVSLRESVEDLREGETERLQLRRVDEDLHLLRRAAEADDVDDSGDGPELPLDDPVLQRLQLERREAGGADEGVTVDLADRRGIRGEARLRPRGEVTDWRRSNAWLRT